MTPDELYAELTKATHSREHRLKFATLVASNSELLPKLLDLLFMVDDKVSCRAAWVLEFFCKDHLETLIPYLDGFTEQIHRVHLDPAVRPVAKICEYLITAYYSKESNGIQSALTQTHQERIVAACFDWMINDQKVAPKAYAMQSLFLLGQDFEWVHPELALILQRDFQIQSSGFKARARHILKRLATR